MAEVNSTGNEVPPNMTIYINNLNEKIKLEGILEGRGDGETSLIL